MVVVRAAGRAAVAKRRALVEATGSRSPVTAQRRDRAVSLIDSGKAQRLCGFASMEILTALLQFVGDNAGTRRAPQGGFRMAAAAKAGA